ncbi:MAG: signal peptidase I [Anaerolineales bacterium]
MSLRERLASVRRVFRNLATKLYPWAPVFGWALLVYLILYLRKPGGTPASVEMYVVQPLLWLSLAAVGWLGLRRGVSDRPRLTKQIAVMAGLVGGFQVSLLVIAGLIFGFGHSPYGHSPWVLLGNLYYGATILVGMELSRACIVAALGRKNPLMAVAVSTIFFALLGIPLARWKSVGDVGAVLRVSGTTLLPAMSENLVASFLSLIGGPGASIIYRGILQAFEWSSPILPNVSWQVGVFLGTVSPSIGLVVIWHEYLRRLPKAADTGPRESGLSTGWVLVAMVGVGLIWLNAGLFGVQPTLVSGMSMAPALEAGDVAFVRQVPPQSVEVGDIIRFRVNGVYVLHRVVSIEGGGSGLWFITRGDANNVNDPPVPASEMQGRVVLVVPKIGWVGIGARKVVAWIGGQ